MRASVRLVRAEDRIHLLVAGGVVRKIQAQKHSLFTALMGQRDQLDDLFIPARGLRQNYELIRFRQRLLQFGVICLKVRIAHRCHLGGIQQLFFLQAAHRIFH